MVNYSRARWYFLSSVWLCPKSPQLRLQWRFLVSQIAETKPSTSAAGRMHENRQRN